MEWLLDRSTSSVDKGWVWSSNDGTQLVRSYGWVERSRWSGCFIHGEESMQEKRVKSKINFKKKGANAP